VDERILKGVAVDGDFRAHGTPPAMLLDIVRMVVRRSVLVKRVLRIAC
jgi:hypothetical protein